MKSSAKDPQILFEDNHLLVVVKPAGWLAQKDAQSHLPDLESWAEAYRMQQENKPGLAFVRACHRLDTPVRGIVCLAKTSKAQQRLQQAQLMGEWRKFYLTVVSPAPMEDQGLRCDWLAQGDGKAFFVREGDPQGKEARLSFVTLAKTPHQAGLGVELLTGRYHQIRAQLAGLGSPIVGDRKYGGRGLNLAGEIYLHHALLILHHPVTRAKIAFMDLPSWAPPGARKWLEDLVKQSDITEIFELH
jgi:23S rRNA pseudouridine1911/1915/1917 synthase